jgi:transglutaminase-like putative cysteine protease
VIRAGDKLRATVTPDGASMKRVRFSFVIEVWLLSAVAAAPFANAQELANLPAISPEDLALKDNPAAPGSAAMILYYAVDTDNKNWTETDSIRIKVFQDEGRKYADVEIPYYDKANRVEEIRARTIGPDGKISEFSDQIYDREIVKAKKVRINAKVLTLPNVQIGTIIEYSYRLRYKEKLPDVFRHPEAYLIRDAYTYPAAEWEVQRSLFVRHGRFTLHGVKGAGIEDFYVGLPSDVRRQNLRDGTIQFDIDSIPAYQEEEYSPPEANLKIRAILFYAVGYYSENVYWEEVAKRRAEQVDKFIGKSNAIQSEAARLVKPGDPDEKKLRQIYERVQQIRAVSYEGAKTEKEMKQENLTENKSAEDVLIHGYAYANEINLLFVALARAAGFHAAPLVVSSRKQAFFMKGYPNDQQLNAMVVAVRVGNGFVYLDPATRFCPYGLLPWEETDTGGVLEDTSYPNLGYTPASKSKDAIERREADLKLNRDGGLNGKVALLYFGQEALSRRLDAIRKDDTERRKDLEESLKNMLVQDATVKLLKVEGWEDSQVPLRAEFEVEVPNFAVPAGKRLILPLGVFHSREKNPFATPRRSYPIYFGYPHESYEQVIIELPPGIQVESVPGDTRADEGAFYYVSSSKKDGNLLETTRTFRVSGYLYTIDQYKKVSQFYDRVLEGDAHQATLVPREAVNSN